MTVAQFPGPRCQRCGRMPSYCPCEPEAAPKSNLLESPNGSPPPYDDRPPFTYGQQVFCLHNRVVKIVDHCERRTSFARTEWVACFTDGTESYSRHYNLVGWDDVVGSPSIVIDRSDRL